MGKGQRAKLARAQAKIDNPKKVTAKKNNKGTNAWVTPVVTTLIIVLLAGILALNVLNNSGTILRSKTVMESENFKVNGTMMQYAAGAVKQSFINSYGEELVSYMQDGYFKESAQTEIETYLVYAEAAKAEGVTLDEEDYTQIDENLTALKTMAKNSGYSVDSYLALAYGKGVKIDDLRDFYELSVLANKYKEMIYDKTEEAVTDEEIETYYKENSYQYTVADVLKYSETLTLTSDMTEEEKTQKKAEFLAKFDAMGAATSEEEFKSALTAYLTDKATAEGTLGDPEAMTPEDQADAAFATLMKSEISLTEAAGWVFENTDAVYARVAGDVKVFVDDSTEEKTEEEDEKAEGEDTSAETGEDTSAETGEITDSVENANSDTSSDTTDTKETYTVAAYYMVSAPRKDDSETKSVGHILFSFDGFTDEEAAKAKAEEILAEYLAGEATKDSFEALAEEYTYDSAVFYENVPEGEMEEAFEAWMFDEARTEGETGIVETSYGYHIMYFVGEGDALWLAECRTAVIGEKTSDAYEALAELYPVKVNESAMKSVKD